MLVEANVRGRDLGGFVDDVRARIRGLERELPPGNFLQLCGQFENQQRAVRRLAVVVPVALALVFLLLYLALGSVAYAALVLLNLPFALVGAAVAVVLFRMLMGGLVTSTLLTLLVIPTVWGAGHRRAAPDRGATPASRRAPRRMPSPRRPPRSRYGPSGPGFAHSTRMGRLPPGRRALHVIQINFYLFPLQRGYQPWSRKPSAPRNYVPTT